MKADIDEKGNLIIYREGMKDAKAFCPFSNNKFLKYCSCKCPKLNIMTDSIMVCGAMVERKK